MDLPRPPLVRSTRAHWLTEAALLQMAAVPGAHVDRSIDFAYVRVGARVISQHELIWLQETTPGNDAPELVARYAWPGRQFARPSLYD